MDKILALLQYYNFEFGDSVLSPNQISQKWQDYQQGWVHLAIVEAIYQGRYKLASVDYILRFWQKRGEPICRFNREFERLICGDFNLPLPVKGIYSASSSLSPKVRTLVSIQNKEDSRENSNEVKEREGIKKEHRIALHHMQLLAESSLFVDKLKSMCAPSIPSNSNALDSSLNLPIGKNLGLDLLEVISKGNTH
jgi:hypothetical protein